MKIYPVIFLLAPGLCACGIKKKIEKNTDLAFRSVFIPRIATTKFLAESIASIFESETSIPDSSILIHSLSTHYYNGAHPFNLKVDSITVKILKDTIVVSEMKLTEACPYLLSDTTSVRVTCRYTIPDSTAVTTEKCLSGYFIIYTDSIVQRDKFIPCTY